MIVGPNVAASYLLGAVLSYGIIGPILVSQGIAFGSNPFEGKWASYTIYSSLSSKDYVNAPSPRYWLLWPGVMIMLCASFAELFVHYKSLTIGAKTAFRETKSTISKLQQRKVTSSSVFGVSKLDGVDEKIRWWMWAPGTVILVILTCVILALQYQMDIATSVVSLLFGVLLSFLSIQVAGVIDQVPTTAVSKATQLVLAGVTKGHYSITASQRINIAGAQIAGGASYAATELMQDFRVGYLLGTPVLQQFLAQIMGNVFAIFLSPGIFILFQAAYPCILDTSIETCPFSVPAAAGWKAIAVAVTSSTNVIPVGSGICAIVLGVFSVFLTAFRHFYLVGPRAKYAIWVPNMSVIGLSMIIPATCFNTVSYSYNNNGLRADKCRQSPLEQQLPISGRRNIPSQQICTFMPLPLVLLVVRV